MFYFSVTKGQYCPDCFVLRAVFYFGLDKKFAVNKNQAENFLRPQLQALMFFAGRGKKEILRLFLCRLRKFYFFVLPSKTEKNIKKRR